MLCTIPSCGTQNKSRAIDIVAERCATAYLLLGLALLPKTRVVVGMGKEVQQRLRHLGVDHVPAWHPGGSAANATPLEMLQNHELAAAEVRKLLGVT